MKVTYIYSILFYIVIGVSSVSCKKIDGFLDKAESGGMTLDQVFGDYVLAEQFLANVYSKLPSEYGTKYANATDEAKSAHGTSPENKINNGAFSPAGNPYNNWTATYQAIRSVNVFLANAEKIPVLTSEQEVGKPRMIGEAHFLRAFFYGELFKRWGEVPLLIEVLDINEDMDQARNSIDEVVSFIVDECNNAAELLPSTYSANHLGRATKGAAMALKARVLLYAASALHNPNEETQKWELAAQAAKDVIDLNLYQLHDDYKLLFHTRSSSEIIFQHTVNYTNFTLQTFVPSQGGQVGIAPLQNLVDVYEMKNGESPFIDYATGINPTINPNAGYDPNNPYVDRDPRFKMSILYNDAKWKGATINTYLGAPSDGINGGFNNTQTGYYLAKLVDETSSRTPSIQNGNNYWIYFRYGEVLLNYAEALNESLSSPNSEVYWAINTIRDRNGVEMPPISLGLTKEEMRQKIRHERRIELAFEGHRYFDIKRWRIGNTVMPEAYGMLITKDPTGGFDFERFLVEERVYHSHFDLFPIMQTEINRNPALEQSPGYN